MTVTRDVVTVKDKGRDCYTETGHGYCKRFSFPDTNHGHDITDTLSFPGHEQGLTLRTGDTETIRIYFHGHGHDITDTLSFPGHESRSRDTSISGVKDEKNRHHR